MQIKEAQPALHPSGQPTRLPGCKSSTSTKSARASQPLRKGVLASARELPFYAKLLTLPGVGKILGMTITMEVGEIKRFAQPGNFASYCRTVECQAHF